ncbi:PAP2 superfamily protein [Colletotrichum karsti]|uniref:PAP2 superfamily protein n=1 Tax=Colletotrichum karsti TaxID=1095194 RepID=A0A9P6I469_9PEZI|nr:PAP2 superfamily protein [Colletotrichum karsti]KAF9876627.1 PAP2 superfamily protein [Colletotrichum karsti]
MGSIRIALSYAFDWILLVVFAVGGLFLGNLTPQKRPFNLGNPDISFPLHDDTVSITNAFLICIVAPILIIFVVSLLLVPGSTVPPGTPKSIIWRRKLWEIHAGWLGLIFSVIATWFIVSTTKNLLGKPRPNAIARCQPDLENIAQYIVGGVASTTSSTAGQLVSADICKNPDTSVVNDGFRSFPSGHSSIAASGLVYLTFFLASKLGVTAPWAPRTEGLSDHSHSAFPSRLGGDMDMPAGEAETQAEQGASTRPVSSVRRQAAAPPIYLVVLTLVPFCVCIYICASRWFDFMHHGIDIFVAFAIGATTSYFGFRFYHLPIGRGAGWAWGPRSEDTAFWAGVGKQGYGHGLTKGRQDYMC